MSNLYESELFVSEIRRPECCHVLKVKWFTTIREIKDQLHAITKYPTSNMQLFHVSNSVALSNRKTLRELGIGGSDKRHTLMLALQFASDQSLIQPIANAVLDSSSKDLIRQVRTGFSSGIGPSKTDQLDCTGGVYFLRASNGCIAAVFKPRDEEQGMPNNPKGHAGNGKVGLREHFSPGKGFVREIAAYLMDFNNFCGVPPTTIVHCEHPSFHYPRANSSGPRKQFPKLGSLQKYIRATDIFEDIGENLIGQLELQKIALLDMRILNCDRNSTNILAIRKQTNGNSQGRRNSRSGSLASLTEDSNDELDMDQFLVEEPMSKSGKTMENDLYQLIPIDHGYCFPVKLAIEEFDWVWFNCPQIRKPVHPEIVKYINSVDIEELIDNITSQVSIPEDSLFLIRLVHHLLVEGIALGLTLRDIAELIARVDYGVASPLEKAVSTAEENAFRAMEVRSGHHTSASPFNDHLSSPRLGSKSPVHNILTLPTTRKDNLNHSEKSSKSDLLRLDDLGPSPFKSNQSVSTFTSFPRPAPFSESSTTSSNSNSMGSNDYFMQDLDPNSPMNGTGDKYFVQATIEFSNDASPIGNYRRFSPALEANPPKVLPFSALEVPTTEMIKFDNQPKLNARDRAFSCYTSEEEIDSGGESLACSPSEYSMLDYFGWGLQGKSIASVPRVVSFGAFESPSLYDVNANDKVDRQFLLLRKEKRKVMARTAEHHHLKFKFAYEAAEKMLHMKKVLSAKIH